MTSDASGRDEPAPADLCTLEAVSRRFGTVLALNALSLSVQAGERIGIVGHNGAGKSTLINILNGALSPSAGRFAWQGRDVSRTWTPAAARHAGVRCVFQELSLVPNLSATDNIRLRDGTLRGLGWRRRARDLTARALADIFPGTAIDLDTPIERLPLGQRQMLEIAQAFSHTADPARLVILDEPTSSLTSREADALVAYLGRNRPQRPATVLISHRMKEIQQASDRIVVLKDGAKVMDAASGGATLDRVLTAMGATVEALPRRAGAARRSATDGSPPVVTMASHGGASLDFVAHAGEIIGLGGLAGHGQSEALATLYAAMNAGRGRASRPAAAFLAGDRQADGIFPAWSVRRNLTVSSFGAVAPRHIIRSARERELTRRWCETLLIKTSSPEAGITSLSGGNQQKVLFARALSTPARVVLMDDPTRGVDVMTKRDIYRHVQEEAASGRTFVWYSTEFEELQLCDRIYLFHDHAIIAQFAPQDLTEDAVLSATYRAEA